VGTRRIWTSRKLLKVRPNSSPFTTHRKLRSEDDQDIAALVTVLCDRLQCEVEALDMLLAMEVMAPEAGG
jgi:hypothetical protein